MTWLKSPASIIVVFLSLFYFQIVQKTKLILLILFLRIKQLKKFSILGKEKFFEKDIAMQLKNLLKLKDFIPIQIGPNGH